MFNSDIEQEVQHVAVLDDVVLAFGAHLAGFLGALFALVLDEVVEGDGLGADEAAFEVGVDDAGGFGGGVAFVDGPGADFLDAGGEVGLQAQEVVAGADEAVEAGFFEAEVGEEGEFVFVVEVGQFGFDLGAEGDDGGAFPGGVFAQSVEVRVVLEAVLGDVGDVHGGLEGHEAVGLEEGLVFGAQVQRAGGFAFVEVGLEFFEQGGEAQGFLVTGAGFLDFAGVDALDGGEVGQGEFGDDGLDVGDGVDAAVDVDDIGVVEAADDVDDGVGLADVGEELVAEAFAFAGASDEAGDVDEFDDGGLDLLGLDDFSELGEAGVRDFDDADVGLDGAEGVVGSFDAGFGQRVEKGGFADVGQADDAALECHGVSFLLGGVGGGCSGRAGVSAQGDLCRGCPGCAGSGCWDSRASRWVWLRGCLCGRPWPAAWRGRRCAVAGWRFPSRRA